VILYSRLQFILFLSAVAVVTVFSVPSKLKLGMIYFHSYKYEKAFEYFNAVKAFDDDNVHALKKIKEYFLIQGDTKKALELQKKLVSIKPKNLNYLIELEKLYDWNLMPYERLKVIERRAAISKTKAEEEKLLLQAANGYRWLRKYEDANRVFSRLKKVDDIGFKKELIDYFLATRQIDNAIELLEEYTLSQNTSFNYNDFLSQAYLLKNNHQGALKQELILFLNDKTAGKYIFTDRFLEKVPKKDILKKINHLERILFHYSELGSVAVIDKIHTKLLNTVPEDAGIRFMVAESRYKNNQKEEAYKLYKTLTGISVMKDMILLDVSRRFSEMDKHWEAINVLKRLTRAYPSNIEFLEELAEEYREAGEKKKALKIYLKIFKLEKKKLRRSTFRSLSQGPLIVFNKFGRKDKPSLILKKPRVIPIIPMGKIKYRLGEIKTNLQKYKGRIIEILEEINNPKESLEVYKDLLNSYPNDLELIKRIGYNYIELNDFKSSYPYFESYLRRYKYDLDSLEILAGRDIQNKDFTKALEKLTKIKEKKGIDSLSIYTIGMLEESYFHTGNKLSRENICKQVFEKKLPSKKVKYKESDRVELEIRCLERAGQRDKAYALLSDLVDKNPRDPRLLTVFIYYEIELRNLESARATLDFLYSQNLYTEENKDQEQYLNEVKEAIKYDYSWDIEALGKFHWSKNYSYYQNDLRVGKRFNKYRLGLWNKQVLTFKDGNQDHGFLAPHISFFNDSDSLELGYAVTNGHKELDAPLYVNAYFGRWDSFKLFLSFKNSVGEYQNAVLANEKKSYTRSLVAYLNEKHLMKKDIWESSLGFESITYREEDGENVFVNTEYLAPIGGRKQFHMGVQLYYRTLSSSFPGIKSIYGSGSEAYYIVLRKEITFEEKLNKYLKAAIKFSIGGDQKRNISFGSSYDVLAEVYGRYGVAKGWRFYTEYFKETDSFSTGNSGNFGFSWNHWF